MSERTNIQDFHKGRENVTDVFVLETGSLLCYGIEAGGVIYYIIPNKNENITTIGMCYDVMNEAIKAISDYSEPRFEVLKEHCPKLCRSIEDCIADRYDRASAMFIEEHCFWVRDITYNIVKRLKENGIEALLDDSILNARYELLKFMYDMVEELDDWEGFTSWEEIKIAAQEALPGVKVGYQISRVLSGL